MQHLDLPTNSNQKWGWNVLPLSDGSNEFEKRYKNHKEKVAAKAVRRAERRNEEAGFQIINATEAHHRMTSTATLPILIEYIADTKEFFCFTPMIRGLAIMGASFTEVLSQMGEALETTVNIDGL